MNLRLLPRELAALGYRLAQRPFGRPLTSPPLTSSTLDEDDVNLARRTLQRKEGWFDQSIVDRYEATFAKWNGSRHAVAFMSGRVALSGCIHALGLKPGDEVIVPGYTCVVVPNAFQFAGVRVVYSDIELDTYGLDASLLESRITDRTRAILLHHLYGLVCRDYDETVSIARRRQLQLIEDCTQSTGARYKRTRVGNLGDVAIYSSEQSKVFTTIQGGLAVTNDGRLAERLREFRDEAPYPDPHDVERQLQNVVLHFHIHKDPQRWWKEGLNRLLHEDALIVSTTREEERGVKPKNYGRRMPGAIAVIGLNQLAKLDDYNSQRLANSSRWTEWCNRSGYTPPLVIPDSTPVFLRYPALVEPERKADTSWARRDLGVSLGVWFVSPLHPSSRVVEGCPNGAQAVARCINFPTLGVGR